MFISYIRGNKYCFNVFCLAYRKLHCGTDFIIMLHLNYYWVTWWFSFAGLMNVWFVVLFWWYRLLIRILHIFFLVEVEGSRQSVIWSDVPLGCDECWKSGHVCRRLAWVDQEFFNSSLQRAHEELFHATEGHLWDVV